VEWNVRQNSVTQRQKGIRVWPSFGPQMQYFIIFLRDLYLRFNVIGSNTNPSPRLSYAWATHKCVNIIVLSRLKLWIKKISWKNTQIDWIHHTSMKQLDTLRVCPCAYLLEFVGTTISWWWWRPLDDMCTHINIIIIIIWHHHHITFLREYLWRIQSNPYNRCK